MTRLLLTADRTFRSLRNRNYRLYFFGQTVSMTGTWMQSVAQMWLVLQLTGSAVSLGITTALQFTPMLLVGSWGGVFADRFDKRRLLFVTQSLAALLAMILGFVVAFGVVQLWMIYGLAFLWGCVIAVDNPTRQSFVAEMVTDDDLSNAVALNSTIVTSARMFGPALAGILISTVGIAICFIINSVSYFGTIAALRAMDTSALRTTERLPRGRGQLRAGFRYAWSTPVLRTTLLLMAVVGTLAYNFRMILPLMADSLFAGGPGTFGALSAVMGAGTIAGALVVAGRARPTRRLLLGSALLFGLSALAVAIAPTLGWAFITLVPLGATSVFFASIATSTMQLHAAPEMRGRVMALYGIVFLGSTPVGGPITGYVAQNLGVRAAIAMGGLATVIAAVYVIRRRIQSEALAAAGRVRLALEDRVRAAAPKWMPGDAPAAIPEPLEEESRRPSSRTKRASGRLRRRLRGSARRARDGRDSSRPAA